LGTSVVVLGAKKCKPFILEVMVMIPESGYKFEVVVEKSCTPQKDVVWKLVFDLYKKIEGEWEQIVHVSFRPGNESETKGIQMMAIDGVSIESAEILSREAFPVAKEFESATPTDDQKARIRSSISRAATKQVEVEV
jgi:hypothetical protein